MPGGSNPSGANRYLIPLSPTGRLFLMAVAMMLPLAMPQRAPALPAVLFALTALCFLAGHRARLAAWAGTAALWTALAADRALQDRLPEIQAGSETILTGTIASLPTRREDQLEFLFLVEQGTTSSGLVPGKLRLRWYEATDEVRAGERWVFRMRWQPPRGRVNFTGRDDERGWFAAGIGALATVRSGLRLERASFGAASAREYVRQWFGTRLADEPAVGVLLALAIADRGLLGEDVRQTMSATGTGHLLAISGLHIGLAAGLGYGAARVLRCLLPLPLRLRWGLRQSWWPALGAAVAYAALAGWGVSTQRALIMLSVLAVAGLLNRRLPAMHAWTVALLSVLACSPLSLLTPGFSLSFAAVAVLLAVFVPRTGNLPAVRRLVVAQLAIMLVTLPFGLFWFERTGTLGLAANLLAIPVVSLGLVPLVLAGLACLALGWPELAHGALLISAWIAEGLLRVLHAMAAVAPWASTEHGAPSLTATLFAVAAGLLALAPGRLAVRVPAALLMLPMLLRGPERAPDGLRLDLLDVGQGLAAVLRHGEETLIYDSGPGRPGHWDMIEPVILPALRAMGRVPQRLIVSHGDLDHAGGLGTLAARFPDMQIAANLRRPEAGHTPCTDRLQWGAPGARFRILHPGPWLPYLGNLSSCVLAVDFTDGSVLLPGDIDTAVERRLVAAGLPAYHVLVAPHHGSKSSSSPEFIEAVRPQWVLFPAGVDNRFDFPAPEVVQRYRDFGAQTASVSECGALSVELQAGSDPVVQSARVRRAALWRWPAGAGCP